MNLLPENPVEKYRLRVDQCVEVGFGAKAKSLNPGKPGRGRTLGDVMANRERARR